MAGLATATGAQEALDKLADLSKQQLIQIQDAALVSWPVGESSPKTKNYGSMTGQGTLSGAFWGMLFGLIFFVPFFGLAVGVAMGALTGKFADYGINDNFIKEVREKVTEGTSALFVAMIFVASGLAASTISTLQAVTVGQSSDTLLFTRALMYQMLNIYVIRMAAVFMISLSTMWLRTSLMPVPVAVATLAIALLLMFAINFSLWIVLVFPAWVFTISVYVLSQDLRRPVGNQRTE